MNTAADIFQTFNTKLDKVERLEKGLDALQHIYERRMPEPISGPHEATSDETLLRRVQEAGTKLWELNHHLRYIAKPGSAPYIYARHIVENMVSVQDQLNTIFGGDHHLEENEDAARYREGKEAWEELRFFYSAQTRDVLKHYLSTDAVPARRGVSR